MTEHLLDRLAYELNERWAWPLPRWHKRFGHGKIGSLRICWVCGLLPEQEEV